MALAAERAQSRRGPDTKEARWPSFTIELATSVALLMATNGAQTPWPRVPASRCSARKPHDGEMEAP
jgi:hypothetical protein